MRGNPHARCGVGEKVEIISKPYLSLFVKIVLQHNANSVILAHVHPGGSRQPSSADIDVTKKISEALKTINVKVIDHIIVAENSFTSFAEMGLLNF